MDLTQRREPLLTADNPDRRMDYVSTLQGALDWQNGGEARITLRYVPDRLILTPQGFNGYLAALQKMAWNDLETLATAIMDDINNEVVARWVQVIVTAPAPDQEGVDAHSVMLEDRQPKWDNDSLLSRLGMM